MKKNDNNFEKLIEKACNVYKKEKIDINGKKKKIKIDKNKK